MRSNYISIVIIISGLLIATYLVRFYMPYEKQKNDTRTFYQIIIKQYLTLFSFKELYNVRSFFIKLGLLNIFCILYTALCPTLGYMCYYICFYCFVFSATDPELVLLNRFFGFFAMLPLVAATLLWVAANNLYLRLYLIEAIGLESYQVYVGENPGSSAKTVGVTATVYTAAAIIGVAYIIAPF